MASYLPLFSYKKRKKKCFFLTVKSDFLCVGVPTILLCCVVKQCDLSCCDHPMEGFACFDCICVHPPPCHIQSFKPFVSGFICLDFVGLHPTLCLMFSHVRHNDLFPKAFYLSILPLSPFYSQSRLFKICSLRCAPCETDTLRWNRHDTYCVTLLIDMLFYYAALSKAC